VIGVGKIVYIEPKGDDNDPRQFDKYGNLKMTGKEWYDRFTKALPPVGLDAVTVEGDKFPDFTIRWSAVDKAAKEAAGIE